MELHKIQFMLAREIAPADPQDAEWARLERFGLDRPGLYVSGKENEFFKGIGFTYEGWDSFALSGLILMESRYADSAGRGRAVTVAEVGDYRSKLVELITPAESGEVKDIVGFYKGLGSSAAGRFRREF